MKPNYRARRFVVALVVAIVSLSALAYDMAMDEFALSPVVSPAVSSAETAPAGESAVAALDALPVKGKAPKTNYARTQFGNGWTKRGDCDTRNDILRRDMPNAVVDEQCKVQRGTLSDPYTGRAIEFLRGPNTSDKVQIDHVVALSNAWQTGAQQLGVEERRALANDPLNLLAVDGPANQKKSDSDAASWLPANKPFRCQYVARQVAVKQKYHLWVTAAERDAMQRVFSGCPGQAFPAP